MAAPILSKPDHSTGEELRLELEALNQALQFRNHTRCKSHSPLPRHSPSPSKHPKPSFKVPFMRSASFISCDRSKEPASPRSIKAHHHQNQDKQLDPPHSAHQEKNGSRNRYRKGHHQQQQHDQRRSLWRWKPLRAISHLIMSSHCRLHVVFTLHVQRIEGLPVPMNGLRLSVRWICKHQGFQTMPSRVFHGIAEFGQTLRHQCTVFGTRGHNDTIRYDAKPSSLSIVALDVDELELAKHHVDLSTLLAQADMLGSTWQEGSQNISYELPGMGKGCTLIVSFSYEIAHQDSAKGDDGTSPTTKKCSKTSNATSKNLQPLKHGFPSIDVSEVSTIPPLSEFGADAAHCNDGEQPGLVKGHVLQECSAEDSVIEASNLSDSGFSSSFEFKPNLGSSLEHEHQDEFSFLHSEGEGPASPKNFEPSLNKEEGLLMNFDDIVHINDDNSNLQEAKGCKIDAQMQSDQEKLRAACNGDQEGSTIGQRTCKELEFLEFSQTEFDDEVERIAEEFLNMLGVN